VLLNCPSVLQDALEGIRREGRAIGTLERVVEPVAGAVELARRVNSR
jgi:hypothetical protein